MSSWATVPLDKVNHLDKFLSYRLDFPGGSGSLDLRGTIINDNLDFEGHLEIAVLGGIKKIVSLSLYSKWLKNDDDFFLFSELKEENRISNKKRSYTLDQENQSVIVNKEGKFKEQRKYKLPDFMPMESLFDPISFFLLGEVIEPNETQKFGFHMNKKFFVFESSTEFIDGNQDNYKLTINQDFGDRIPRAFLPTIEISHNSIVNFEVNLKLGKLKVTRV